MSMPEVELESDDEDAPELAPIEQLEFFRDIRPAYSYIQVPGFGLIPARGQDGERLVLSQKDEVKVEMTILVYAATAGNKPRKVKGLPNYISTKRDDFVYQTMAIDAEVVRVKRV